MALDGLPDFQHWLRGEGAEVVLPFAGVGAAVVLPHAVELDTEGDGGPAFHLQIMRPVNPMLPPEPYGVLELAIRPRYALSEGLQVLRQRDPMARLQPAVLMSRCLRFVAQAATAELPDELARPAALAWNGLTGARLNVRVSLASALFIEHALTDTVPLRALAEIEIAGLATRIAMQARFDPAAVVAALAARADAERRISHDALLAALANPADVGFELTGASVPSPAIALALADRIRARLASFCPAPSANGHTYLQMVPAETAGSGREDWDLAAPLRTYRAFALSLDPIAAAAAMSNGHQDRVLSRVVVPTLRTGFHTVSVHANLPAHRPAVLAVGVSLRVPPLLPSRPQSAHAAAELLPPDDAASLELRLSPREPLAFRYSTFVVLAEQAGPRRFDGVERDSADDRLNLTPDDFPVSFLSCDASRDLLELAAIEGRCRWSGGALTFGLTLDAPAVAVPLPPDAADAMLEVSARPHGGGADLRIGPLPAQPTSLGLHSFPEYGPHLVSVECRFGGATSLVAVELANEDDIAAARTATVLALTPAAPRREWRYLARSPFRAGYRFRVQGAPDQPAPWSAWQSPFTPLIIEAA